MAWTAPNTAVAGSAFTAAMWNTYIRDNLNELAAAKATTLGSIFATTAPNAIAERIPTQANTGATEATGSTSYVDLATVGPSITLNTGTQAIVIVYCNLLNSAGVAAWMSYAVSGSSTVAATDSRSFQMKGTGGQRGGVPFLQTGLTAGSNTFTAKYRVSTSGTATFSARRLAVIPF